jgi:hypothetical protein
LGNVAAATMQQPVIASSVVRDQQPVIASSVVQDQQQQPQLQQQPVQQPVIASSVVQQPNKKPSKKKRNQQMTRHVIMREDANSTS